MGQFRLTFKYASTNSVMCKHADFSKSTWFFFARRTRKCAIRARYGALHMLPNLTRKIYTSLALLAPWKVPNKVSGNRVKKVFTTWNVVGADGSDHADLILPKLKWKSRGGFEVWRPWRVWSLRSPRNPECSLSLLKRISANSLA